MRPLTPPSVEDFQAMMKLLGAHMEFLPSHRSWLIRVPTAAPSGDGPTAKNARTFLEMKIDERDMIDPQVRSDILSTIGKAIQE